MNFLKSNIDYVIANHARVWTRVNDILLLALWNNIQKCKSYFRGKICLWTGKINFILITLFKSLDATMNRILSKSGLAIREDLDLRDFEIIEYDKVMEEYETL